MYSPASEDVVGGINSILEKARDAGCEVVFTRDVHAEDQFEGNQYYDEFKQWGEHVVEGSWGAELVDSLDVNEDDFVVDKPTYDAFYDTSLHEWLVLNGITDLIICGTLANVCVLHTASSAGFRDYKPVLIEDGIGYIEESHRKYALEHADWLFGEVDCIEDIEFGEE